MTADRRLRPDRHMCQIARMWYCAEGERAFCDFISDFTDGRIGHWPLDLLGGYVGHIVADIYDGMIAYLLDILSTATTG